MFRMIGGLKSFGAAGERPLDPRLPKEKPGYVLTVHIGLGDAITLDRLDIPKHVDVRSAGDFERFINAHRKRAND
jgi:hypothetical protein